MTDTTTSNADYPKIPRADADSRSLYDFIDYRRDLKKQQTGRDYYTYSIRDFLRDVAEANTGNLLSSDKVNDMIGAQAQVLHNSFQYMIHAHDSYGDLDKPLQVQRSFCHLMRLVHQMDKFANPPQKD